MNVAVEKLTVVRLPEVIHTFPLICVLSWSGVTVTNLKRKTEKTELTGV